MSKELLLEVIKKEELSTPTTEQDNLLEMMSLISEMNIVDFEPLLEEDLNSELHESFPGKYHILAILRDLFIKYKEGGDTQILVEQGTCGHNCERKCEVVNLQGNNTGKNFAFGLDKSGASVVNFHPCFGFVDANKSAKYIDGDLMMSSLKKEAEMKGKDTSGYDDSMKSILMSAVEVFHKP